MLICVAFELFFSKLCLFFFSFFLLFYLFIFVFVLANCVETVKFLLEKGARIQAAIVDSYPDIVHTILKDGIINDQVLYRKGGWDGECAGHENKV